MQNRLFLYDMMLSLSLFFCQRFLESMKNIILLYLFLYHNVQSYKSTSKYSFLLYGKLIQGHKKTKCRTLWIRKDDYHV